MIHVVAMDFNPLQTMKKTNKFQWDDSFLGNEFNPLKNKQYEQRKHQRIQYSFKSMGFLSTVPLKMSRAAGSCAKSTNPLGMIHVVAMDFNPLQKKAFSEELV